MFILLQDTIPDVSGISAGSSCIACKEKNEIGKLFLPPPLLFPHPRCLLSFKWLLEVFNGRESIARERVLSANLLVCGFSFLFVAGLLWS